MFKFMNRLSARLTIRALERGKFYKLMQREREQAWIHFVERQASTPHVKRVVLRLTMDKRDPWYLWVVYHITSVDPILLVIDSLISPADEDAKLQVPDELADEAYFSP